MIDIIAKIILLLCLIFFVVLGVFDYIKSFKRAKRREERIERFMCAIEKIANSK